MSEDRLRELEAETLALQALVVSLSVGMKRLGWEAVVLQAYDEAANFIEGEAVKRGHPHHLAESLKIVEQMRVVIAGQSKPRHGV